MLAYAPTDRPAARSGSPRALTLVLAGHAALFALVLTARGQMPDVTTYVPTDVTFIDPVEPPPPPRPDEPRPRTAPPSSLDNPPAMVPTPLPSPLSFDDTPVRPNPAPFVGPSVDPVPLPLPEPTVAVVRKAARFATPAADVRPPYPEAKRRSGEEASLRLALEIDARGRVVSVDPVGAADPAFLDAARRHILKRWRYAPASEDGAGVASRITVTLRFELGT